MRFIHGDEAGFVSDEKKRLTMRRWLGANPDDTLARSLQRYRIRRPADFAPPGVDARDEATLRRRLLWHPLPHEVSVPDRPAPASEPIPNGLHFTRRRDDEPPPVTAQLGWRYHHVGIPTTVARPGATHLQEFDNSDSGTRRFE